jgi:hypothetical protein
MQLVNGQIKQSSEEEVQMANKYVKKCSTLLAIKEIQIKMTLRFYLTPVQMGIITKTKKVRHWWFMTVILATWEAENGRIMV